MAQKKKQSREIPVVTPQSSPQRSDKRLKSDKSTPQTTHKSGISGQQRRLSIIVLFFTACLLYANTLTHQYCQDDAIVITQNDFTKAGFGGFYDIMRYDTFYGFFKEGGKAALVEGGRYRPFTLLMFATEYQIFGDNPFIFHLVNVLLFGFLTVLLYVLFLKLLNYRSVTEGSSATMLPLLQWRSLSFTTNELIAFFTALLFAIHPLHTEVVANIKGRDEIMTLIGSLGALYLSLKAYETGHMKYYLLSGLLFLVGLLSKENAITFLAVVPLVYYVFIRASAGRILRLMLPFMAMSVVFLWLRHSALHAFDEDLPKGFVPAVEMLNDPYLKFVDNQYVPFSTSEKAATITFTLGKYVKLLFFPNTLTHDYYPRHISMMSFGNFSVLLSLGLYVLLLRYLRKGLPRRRLIAFGIAYFLITLSIVSNVVFPVGTNMAERFMFMPSVGFCFILSVWGVGLLRGWMLSSNMLHLSRQKGRILSGNEVLTTLASEHTNMRQAKLPLILFSIIILLLSIKTIDRNAAWKDNYTIFTTDIKTSFNSAKLQNSVGGEMIEKFNKETNTELRQKGLVEAIGHIDKAIEIHPTYKNAYLLRGNAHLYLKEYDKSIIDYLNALRLDTKYQDAKNNLVVVYREAGKDAAQQQHDIPKGIDYFVKALEINPKETEILSLLGTAYGLTNQPLKSIDVLERSLAVRYDKSDVNNLIIAYKQTQNVEKAAYWEGKLK